MSGKDILWKDGWMDGLIGVGGWMSRDHGYMIGSMVVKSAQMQTDCW